MNESWSGYEGSWICRGGTPPIEVPSGAMHVDTLIIEGPNSWAAGRPRGSLEGTFRVGLRLSECAEIRCRPVDSIRFSNPFRVRLAVGTVSADDSVAGCYMLGYVEGVGPSWFAQPPQRFRLYADRGSKTSNSGSKSVRPLIALGDSSTAMWTQRHPDSLVVTWRSGFSGYRLHLTPDGGLLHGALEIFSVDLPLRERFTDAVARRVNCDDTFRFL